MKQVIYLLLLWFFIFIWYNLYQIYQEKSYTSNYDRKVRSSNVVIEPISFDKETIEKLNDKIGELIIDEPYVLNLERGTRNPQPIFVDSYQSLYEKVLQQQRAANNFER